MGIAAKTSNPKDRGVGFGGAWVCKEKISHSDEEGMPGGRGGLGGLLMFGCRGLWGFWL